MFRLTYLVIEPLLLEGDELFCFVPDTAVAYDFLLFCWRLMTLLFMVSAVGGAGGKSKGADLACGFW